MKKSKATKLLTSYHDPHQPGSLGGVARVAQTLKLPTQKVWQGWRKDLGYIHNKPRRKCFPTLPVFEFNIDQQWVVDLMELQNISKYNKGMHYLLMRFLSTHWNPSTETGKVVTEASEKILKPAKGRELINLQTNDGKEFHNIVCWQTWWNKKHSPFLDQWLYQSQYHGTFQSYFQGKQGKVALIFHGPEHPRLFIGVARFGQRTQCVLPSHHQHGTKPSEFQEWKRSVGSHVL